MNEEPDMKDNTSIPPRVIGEDNSMSNITIGDFRLDYNRMWGLGEHIYQVGDIVSRTGRDEHIITKINAFYDLLSIRCIKTYPGCYCNIGEEEDNVTRRYSFVRSKDESR